MTLTLYFLFGARQCLLPYVSKIFVTFLLVHIFYWNLQYLSYTYRPASCEKNNKIQVNQNNFINIFHKFIEQPSYSVFLLTISGVSTETFRVTVDKNLGYRNLYKGKSMWHQQGGGVKMSSKIYVVGFQWLIGSNSWATLIRVSIRWNTTV